MHCEGDGEADADGVVGGVAGNRGGDGGALDNVGGIRDGGVVDDVLGMAAARVRDVVDDGGGGFGAAVGT